MTIEPAARATSVRQWIAAIGCVLTVAAGWLAVVLVLTFVSPPGKSMAIIGPPSQAFEAVSKTNGRVLSASGYVTVARSDEPDFVAQLYAAGALLVLDAEQAGGCSGGVQRMAAKL